MKLTTRALALVVLVVSGGVGVAATSHAGEPIAQLHAHGMVVWVLERSETGEVLSTREGFINVTAQDTDPGSSHCAPPTCGPSSDRILATIDDTGRLREGSFELHQLPGHSTLYLPGGVDLLFVDGGEPGTASVGPPKSAGVATTRDYVQWLNISASFTLKAYLLTGNIQLTGGR
jgi:hypothetical protein